MADKLRIGIIGCGAISPAYFNGSKPYSNIEITACADLLADKARQRAEEFGIAKACSVDELIADPEIDMICNLTVPKAHAEINLCALEAGKHAYVEKPFAVLRSDAQRVLTLARQNNLRTGSAPDTFLGGGIQTARKLLDDGAIGEPVAVTAFLACHGHESWHPSPEFYYELGGGPMFDMGPYYITALVNLLGPVARVSGSAKISFAERTITSEPKKGKVITVETPTHLAGTLDFANGAVGTVIMSFDVWRHNLPTIEIHGSEGSMTVPDPNGFGGPVKVFKNGTEGWDEVSHTHSTEIGRGTGLADMAKGIQTGRAHRASGDLATHVLDIMTAFEESSAGGRHIQLSTTCQRPAPLLAGLKPGELD